MKFNKAILAVSLLVGTFTACTDKWDDHYAVAQHGEGTLWQAISNDPSLSNFKQVLEAVYEEVPGRGRVYTYKEALSGSQVFTVFAPNNTELTDDYRDLLIDAYHVERAKDGLKNNKTMLVKNFIQNHISLYNYSVSDVMRDTVIRMMNGKNLAFGKDKFAGNAYLTTNKVTGNGILFTMDKTADYMPNVYEALNLAKDYKLDYVWNYVKKFDVTKLNSAESFPGEIKDGKTHYLDSVTYIENDLLEETVNAKILNEDSCYWMVVPEDALWEKLVDKYSKYYKYDEKVAERDSFQLHFPRYAILAGAAFSKSSNPKIFQDGSATAKDSIMSTNAIPYTYLRSMYGNNADNHNFYTYYNPYGAGGVLTDCEPFECSHGKLLIAKDKWNIPEERTFLRTIVMEAESNQTLDTLNVSSSTNKSGDTNPAKTYSVSTDNPFYNKVSGNQFLEISPSGVSNFSKALFDVRGVLSGVSYDIYVVTVPAIAGDTLASEKQKLPIIFRCAVQCHDEKGDAYYVNIKDGKLQYKVLDAAGKPTTDYTKAVVYGENHTNNPDKVDSVLIGTVTFPVSSYGVSEPQVKLLFQSYVGSSAFEKTANRTLRLDCIVFKPSVKKDEE